MGRGRETPPKEERREAGNCETPIEIEGKGGSVGGGGREREDSEWVEARMGGSGENCVTGEKEQEREREKGREGEMGRQGQRAGKEEEGVAGE